ncbi:hypothetical protein [Candidatus Endoriftia persephone]|jgi:hypothetical protein|uniref:Alginate export domain-containing protein n=3 Tax=Gammaproteobacteria TaxID=1236 RepID=G2FFB0_9GAMM|nr:hypothetical protein [Candidatus Endoriftia persephone]EGW54488.1 hypothetical protein TevJSym_al00220 [endosymbiont of Tevnia jerichonana (vent Tica)]USF88992.1 hypothetical protein L0Y14_07105 [Candidatus Endoriftia persephone]
MQRALRRLFILFALLPLPLLAGEWSGYIEAQGRYFSQHPLEPEQRSSLLSLAAEPEFYHAWDDDRQSLVFRPFYRWDSADSERSHGDIRELLWTYAAENWELQAGIGKVFWGVTEARHLVDIINQTDLVENLDAEQKLGQPMIRFSSERDWGLLDLFVLPGFRERTFPGIHGRFRSQPRVDRDLTRYESDKEDRHIDLAIRWAHSLGDWDIGLAHFHGTSRTPDLAPASNTAGETVLAPFYPLIDQTSLDLQATKGDWLWKLEAAYRSGQGDAYSAATGGFEYTYVGVLQSDMDLGVLMEYLYDERGDAAPIAFENDLFIGLRLTANDAQSSELLTGVIRDLDSGALLFNLEASRRLGDSWKAAAQIRIWSNIPEDDQLYAFSRDDYVELSLARYF